jgi:hypothetical protein
MTLAEVVERRRRNQLEAATAAERVQCLLAAGADPLLRGDERMPLLRWQWIMLPTEYRAEAADASAAVQADHRIGVLLTHATARAMHSRLAARAMGWRVTLPNTPLGRRRMRQAFRVF